MSLCINPLCTKPENGDRQLFCQSCGSELLLAGHYRVRALLSNKGGFGNTDEVETNGAVKVLKVLTSDHSKAIALFEQEAQILSQLNHRVSGGDEFSDYEKSSLWCVYLSVGVWTD